MTEDIKKDLDASPDLEEASTPDDAPASPSDTDAALTPPDSIVSDGTTGSESKSEAASDEAVDSDQEAADASAGTVDTVEKVGAFSYEFVDSEKEPDAVVDDTEPEAGSFEPETESVEAEPIPEPEKVLPVKDDFKPFYQKEARRGMMSSIVQYLLFILLGVWLVGSVVESFLVKAPFKWDLLAIGLIGLVLVGVLWKIISLEVKVGILAVAVGLCLTYAYAVYGGQLGFPGLAPQLMLPIFFFLCLAAILLAVWKLWPRLHWLPIVITVVVAYTALAPIFYLVGGGSGPLTEIVTGPSFMSGWPIYIRSGYLMAQLVLPVGLVLFLILQVRTLFRAQYDTHWGFVFWTLFLIFGATVGLTALERANEPVFPTLGSTVAELKLFPAAIQTPAPSATKVDEETPVASADQPSGSTEEAVQPATPAGESEKPTVIVGETDKPAVTAGETDEPAVTAGETDEPATPTGEADEPVPPKAADETAAGLPDESDDAKKGEPGESGDESAAPEQAWPEQTEPTGPVSEEKTMDRDDTAAFEARILSLEDEVRMLKERLDAQDRLIRSLLNYLGTSPDRETKQEEVDKPPVEPDQKQESPDEEPANPETYRDRDYT